MKISVALCTYNGSRFLREQLDSIAGQTRPPDELVICDDRSSDDAVEIAREFAAGAAFAVTVHVNDANLGSTANFAGAIERCTGDIIALSDQDDVWLPQKLERIEAEFEADAGVGLVFSNATLTDDELRPLGIDLWRETFRRRDQRSFARGHAVDILLQYNVVTGATIAFRTVLKPVLLPIPKLEEFIHDGWIALVAAMCSRVRPIREPLIKYRQHSAQQLGAGLMRWQDSRPKRYELTIEDRRIALARLNDLREIFSREKLDQMRLVELLPEQVPIDERMAAMLEDAGSSINAHIEHITARASLPAGRPVRLRSVLIELMTGRYGRFSRGWQSAVLDLVRK